MIQHALVQINGITQIAGIDYGTGGDTISFSTPPPMGSRITVTYLISPSGSGSICKMFEGNGHTYLWNLGEDNREDEAIQNLLKDAWDMRTIPAVADMLERLKVVIELVKENG